MKTDFSKKYTILLMLLMFIFSLSKIYFMYFNTFAPQNGVSAFVRTAAILLSFYFILNYILFRKSFVLKLIIHELLAVIVLADMLYFKYFNALPLGTDIQLLPNIPSIWDSITQLIRPEYLLLFVDLFAIIAFQLIWGKKTKPLQEGFKLHAIAAVILISTVSFDCAVFGSSNSYQNFDNFGLLHFHGSQLNEMLFSKETFNSDILLIKSLDKASERIRKQPKNFGIARDRNIIIIQVESLQALTINLVYNQQEITPNLNKLIKQDTIYFNNYFHNIAKGGTSDAEFTTLNSLYPASDLPSFNKYTNNSLYSLPKILKDKGYNTLAFHGYKPDFWNRINMYPVMGFDKFISESQFKKDEVIGWGVSDKSFFSQALTYLQKAKTQPFCAFLVTLTNHYPYNLPEEYKSLKLPKAKSTFIERYLQSTNYTDAALGQFISELKKKGLYDNSIIAIYGDHHAISNRDSRLYNEMSKLLGYKYDDEEMSKVPLIVHIPNSNINETISIVGGQLDFLPTMLNLLGINKGDIKFYGQDLCNTKNGFAATQLLLPKGSFIDDDKVFIMAADGIFENGTAWDRKTKKQIDIELCRTGYEKVMKETEECNYLLSKNLLLETNPKANNK